MEELTTTIDEEKIKVDKAMIIVSGTKEKPYFEILYHVVGKGYDNVGYSSYDLNNVFDWKEECFEVVKQSMLQRARAGIASILRKISIFIE